MKYPLTLGLFEVCPPDALARCNNLDVVKTRMQGTKASQYKNTLDRFLNKSHCQRRVRSSFMPVVPRSGRVVSDKGIIFMSFETIQKTLRRTHLFQFVAIQRIEN
jgi:hypothetical protein